MSNCELTPHRFRIFALWFRDTIKGMLTDMVSCVRELVLQGIAVKIPDLAIFSIGIKNKEGAASEKEFSITKNIAGLKLRARGTGEFKANSLNLDASLKKATAVTGDVTPPDGGKDNTGDTTQGGGTNQGGDSTQTGGSGNTESSGSDGSDGLE